MRERLAIAAAGAVAGVCSAALLGVGGWLALELARAKAEEARFHAALRSLSAAMAGR